MTTIELNARKADVIRLILNDINSEVVVGELENLLQKFVSIEPPCRYTPEEIQASAHEAIQQRKTERYTSHEAIKRLIE